MTTFTATSRSTTRLRLLGTRVARRCSKALRSRQEAGQATLATVVVGLLLTVLAAATFHEHVARPLQETADRAVTTFDQRLDCYASSRTYCS